MNSETGRSRRRLAFGGIAAIVALSAVAIACGGGGGGNSSSLPTAAPVANYPYPVQRFDEVQPGHQHLAPGQTFDGYNSNPPTSGPHAPVPAAWGISDVAITKESAVHDMEHAGVVVWYNCNAGQIRLTTDQCAKLRSDLAGVVQPLLSAGKKVVMTPYAGMEHRIALTAWQYLDTFDDFDATRVKTFISTFECHTDVEHFC
jgi:hypothetical protein